MHAQELLFCVREPATSCTFLRVACGWILQDARTSLRVEAQELLCGRNLESQELLCGKTFEPQELLYSIILARKDPYQDSTRQGPIYIFQRRP